MNLFKIDIGLEVNQGNRKEKLHINKENEGTFREWCAERGLVDEDGRVTCECICEAKKTKSKLLHKRATFAYNFGFKRNGKTCECMEQGSKRK